MKFIDTHAHLAMLEHAPLQEILMRAKTAQIETLVTVSVDEKSWLPNQNIAEKEAGVFYSLGMHPHDAKDWLDAKPRMLAALNSPVAGKCVAIGETGIDFHYNHSARHEQIQAFTEQLQIAKERDLPVIIHCRDAFEDTFAAVKKIGLCSRGGVMHCFTGNKEQAFQAVDLGLKISFSGILTFKKAEPIQQAARALNQKDIVIETDCPFLAPVPFRGKPNEPSLLIETAKFLATLRGEKLEEVAAFTTANAQSLFALPV